MGSPKPTKTRANATRFATYADAHDFLRVHPKCVKGWPAWRVEELAVEHFVIALSPETGPWLEVRET
jgi:hypothetical protein